MTITSRTTCLIVPLAKSPHYGVSRDGSVWTKKVRVSLGIGKGSTTAIGSRWNKLSGCINHDGYRVVDIDGVQTRVSRLILETFIGPCPLDMQACHSNGVRTDNRVENLSWGTAKQNADDREEHGTTAKGEKQGSSKITSDTVLKIRRWKRSGKSIKFLAALFGLSETQVRRIVKLQNWKHI